MARRSVRLQLRRPKRSARRPARSCLTQRPVSRRHGRERAQARLPRSRNRISASRAERSRRSEHPFWIRWPKVRLPMGAGVNLWYRARYTLLAVATGLWLRSGDECRINVQLVNAGQVLPSAQKLREPTPIPNINRKSPCHGHLAQLIPNEQTNFSIGVRFDPVPASIDPNGFSFSETFRDRSQENQYPLLARRDTGTSS